MNDYVDFLQNIKTKSSFYRDLWGYCPLSLDQLPIINQEAFWDANDWHSNKLLTDTNRSGVVFKSGGTTGRPKFSIFTKEEWHDFTKIFGQSMDSVLDNGDRVANLFYSGELYASFLFIEKSLEQSTKQTLTFPVAGSTSLKEMVKIILDYDINVLAAVPTSLMALAEYILEENIKLGVSKILFGGESLFDDQRPLLEKAFNQPVISSIGYASVDAGHLGGSMPQKGSKAHRVLDGTVMQIVDDEDQLITTAGIRGRLIMTNLTRTLMPIIRYPVGDQAQWIEPGKSFLVLGRTDEGVRLGPVTVNRDDLASIFLALKADLNFQLVIDRVDGKDLLSICYVGQVDQPKALESLLIQRKMLADSIDKGLIWLPKFVKVKELEKNVRTGKLKFVIDRRF